MSRPKGSKNKNKSDVVTVDENSIHKSNKKSTMPENEAWNWFDGLDNEGLNIDLLLSGKKLTWKKVYLVWLTNVKKHGKVMSDKMAFDTGDHTCDKFFSGAYKEGHFIIKGKKTQQIIFDEPADFGNGFIKLCDKLNAL